MTKKDFSRMKPKKVPDIETIQFCFSGKDDLNQIKLFEPFLS